MARITWRPLLFFSFVLLSDVQRWSENVFIVIRCSLRLKWLTPLRKFGRWGSRTSLVSKPRRRYIWCLHHLPVLAWNLLLMLIDLALRITCHVLRSRWANHVLLLKHKLLLSIILLLLHLLHLHQVLLIVLALHLLPVIVLLWHGRILRSRSHKLVVCLLLNYHFLIVVGFPPEQKFSVIFGHYFNLYMGHYKFLDKVENWVALIVSEIKLLTHIFT